MPVRPLVELDGLTKRFPGVLANDAVDLALRPGEVHVLLGENGAGKSTLVAMLSGLLAPDDGRILIDGRERRIGSPAEALTLGIGTVFQHAMLVPSLSVVDNLALGGGPWWRRPARAQLAATFARICTDIGVTLDPSALVGALSLGEQQQVEIVRALMRGSRVLILDEATAMLTPKGADDLGALMRRLVARDLAIVFITHKLNEALAFGDRVSVLRLGRKVGELPPERLTALGSAAKDEVIRLMFGMRATSAEETVRRTGHAGGGAPVLAVEGLTVVDGEVGLHGIDLEVDAGEILGIAGIDGNGQKQLAEALSGQRRLDAGRIRLDGRPIELLPVGERRRLGLRYVTDDRLGEGTVAPFPVSLNLLLKEIGAAPYWRRGIEQPALIDAHAEELVEAFDIRTPGVATPIGKLSGGNIQKAILARELTGTSRAVIFAKPTYGLDLQNIRSTRARIARAAGQGVAVLLISTDLDELLALSDRIAVMAAGQIVGTVANGPDARNQVGELMSGVAA